MGMFNEDTFKLIDLYKSSANCVKLLSEVYYYLIRVAPRDKSFVPELQGWKAFIY